MESSIIAQLSEELQIAPEFIIREDWEMRILDKLAQSEPGQALIFKGGTALRLAYNSPRFSEDLDFDLGKKILFKDFKNAVNGIINEYSELKLKDSAEKYNTFLAELGVRDDYLSRNISIKIEVSTRNIRNRQYSELKMLVSPVTALQVLIPVAKLAEIENEKLKALKARKQPRDLFDLWYLAQLKREPWQIPENSIESRELKRELNKFLPKNKQAIINELIK